MEVLRGRTSDLLKIAPDGADYRFGSSLSLGDLLPPDHARRLVRAFELAR
ncbi:hypothetical protein ACF09H_29665 [Streptomyces sp. NPDC014983]